MNEQNCAARKALEGCISLFENWRDGHFWSLGIKWEVEPPAIVSAREALAAPCEHATERTIGEKLQMQTERDQLRAKLETLKAERQECVRVLKPFADWYSTTDAMPPTHGQVRRAYELHASLAQEKPEVPR